MAQSVWESEPTDHLEDLWNPAEDYRGQYLGEEQGGKDRGRKRAGRAERGGQDMTISEAVRAATRLVQVAAGSGRNRFRPWPRRGAVSSRAALAQRQAATPCGRRLHAAPADLLLCTLEIMRPGNLFPPLRGDVRGVGSHSRRAGWIDPPSGCGNNVVFSRRGHKRKVADTLGAADFRNA